MFVKDVLDLWYSGYCLFLAVGNSENSKKTKHLNEDEIKKQLMKSIMINKAVEIDEIIKQAGKVEKPEDLLIS